MRMATKHRRIALTADPELDAAIAAARRELGDVPESRVVRELALRGAAGLPADPTSQAISDLRRRGVSWPRRSMADSLRAAPMGEPDPDDPYRGTRALEDVREDRI
jgi:hypothetical protein